MGTAFFVQCDVASVGAAVDRLLHTFRRSSCGVPGRRRYSLVGGEPGPGHALYRDCSVVLRHSSWGGVVAALLSELNLRAVDGFGHLAVHAGAVARDGRVLAFPAASGGGKSTLTAACLQAGFDYVSDEALCLDFATRSVLPYPRPVMLSEHSRSLLDVAEPPPPLGGSDEAALLPEDLGSRTAHCELLLGDVVMLARADGPPRLRRLAAPEAMALLLRMSFNHYKRPRETFDLVAAVASRLRAWELEYDHPRPAAQLMWNRLGAGLSQPA
ncbi:MAG: hypothetical protein M3378_11185 [Actinomycetota bacterium]|nr:hypothetical protein [Actinomycetota bacterium]